MAELNPDVRRAGPQAEKRLIRLNRLRPALFVPSFVGGRQCTVSRAFPKSSEFCCSRRRIIQRELDAPDVKNRVRIVRLELEGPQIGLFGASRVSAFPHTVRELNPYVGRSRF